MQVERSQDSGGRVRNAYAIYPQVGDNGWKQPLIPHNTASTQVLTVKDLLPADERASD